MLTTLLACHPEVSLTGTTDEQPLDLRITDAELPPIGPDQLVLDGPEIVVPPGADVMYCLYGTYAGPTVGMHDIHSYQGRFGHHFVLNGTTTPAIDVPDGTVVDCTTADGAQMADLKPLGVPNHATVDGEDLELQDLALPDGMAVQLETGTRYLLQSHYLNAGTVPLQVRDRVVITTVPSDEVEEWAAPLVFNRSDFVIPSGGTLTTSFRCSTETDLHLLYMLAHMHEWGTAFAVDRIDAIQGDEQVTPFFAVPVWDPVFRDAPPVLDMTGASLEIPAGTTFETRCSWENDTDEDLVFPHEMCDAVSIVYPQVATIVCDGGGQP